MTFLTKHRSFFAAGLFIIVALVNLGLLSINHTRSWKDAQEYSTLATHLISSNSYSMDGEHFTIFREPGYPAFVALVYAWFGIENFLALSIIQTLLLALLGYFAYSLIRARGHEVVGIIAGVFISGLPLYGLYTNEVLTEILFAFLLGALFWLAVHISTLREKAPWAEYLLFGILCGYTSLVRVQFLFFFPIIAIAALVYFRPTSRELLKKLAIAAIAFVTPLIFWISVVYMNTGSFALTEGRQELSLHIRAARAELSYSDLTRYAIEWVTRSITGGSGTEFLYTYEFKNLAVQHVSMATTSEAAAKIRSENIQTILTNPGHYIYGSGIELMKLLYIEHDYTNRTNRYVRAGLYAGIYAMFMFGIWMLTRQGNNDLKRLAYLALIFIGYNCLSVIPFDAIPRYNTPYLFFFIIVGFVGILMWNQNRISNAATKHKPRPFAR